MDPSALSDQDFLIGFEACALPPTAFDHRGHLRLGWVFLQQCPLPEAEARVCQGIERFAVHLGVPGKYNATLTVALLRLMAQGGGADPSRSFSTFLALNPELVSDAKGLLARHYSPAQIESEAARRAFVPPDCLPLPA